MSSAIPPQAALSPAWPEFIDDPKGRGAVLLATILSCLTTLVVGTRLILRKLQKFGWGLDDYLIVAALVCIWGLTGSAFYTWHYGLGRHLPEVPILYWMPYLKVLYAFDLFYILDIGLVKLSILFFYERIFAIDRKTLLLLRWIEGLIFVWTLTFMIAMIFQCLPISYFWTRIANPAGGYCVNLTVLYTVHAATNILTDLIIYIFPMPIVWKLSISKPKKIGVLLVFFAGGFVVALSIVRSTSIDQIVADDFSYADVRTGIWAILEVTIGCITACLPTIKSLFVGSCGLFGSRNSRSNGYSYASDSPSSKFKSIGSGGRRRENDSSDAFATEINAESADKEMETGIPMDSIHVKHDLHWSADGRR
ncbi:MAG: hypothetical protein M4579_002854 [Chaenotheca gracillima]|nr:MAG: hypothetical protein M4579_002854 [Chaenotheca gracillima]